jgi:WD40 repeat protein
MAFSVSDSTLVYRPGGEGGLSPTRLGWRNREGRVVETLAETAQYGSIALSPNGLIAVGRARPSEFRLFDQPGISKQLAKNAVAAVWSPDGNAIVYGTRPGPIVKKDLRTSREVTILQGQDHPSLTSWSPDGRTVLYGVTSDTTGLDIWEAPLDGGKPHPYLATPSVEGQAQFSPDGRWVVYVSDESGRREVWVRTYPVSDEAVKISDGGGYMPEWRADGHALYYLDAANWLVEVDVHLSPSFLPGLSRKLFHADVNQGLSEHFANQYGVSRDGTRFLFKIGTPDPPIMVLLNWPSVIVR